MRELTALKSIAEAASPHGSRDAVDRYFSQLQDEAEEMYEGIDKLRKTLQSSVLRDMLKTHGHPETESKKVIQLVEAAWKVVKELDNEIDDLYMSVASGIDSDHDNE